MVLLVAAVFLFNTAIAAAGTLWIEDWTAQNLDKWYFHTFNAFGPTDSYQFDANPGSLTMTGNSWGLESKQAFNPNAPISVESVVRVKAVTPGTATFAGITVYTGESMFEEIALVDDLDERGLHVSRVTESNRVILPEDPDRGFLNRRIDHNQFIKLRLDYDGRGNWTYFVGDVPCYTVSNRPLTTPPNIFILSVASNTPTLGDPGYIVETTFRQVSVRANYNLFSNTTWVNFSNQDNLNVDTARSCAWEWSGYPQCDILQLMPDPDNEGKYRSSGYSISPLVTLPDGLTWGQVMFTTALDGQKIRIQVLDEAGELIPDSVLPGNQAGFSSGPFVVAGLDGKTYPALRLRADFSTTDPTRTPKLLDWTLTFGINHYFTWYDQQSLGMRDWLLMSNAGRYSAEAYFQAQLGSRQARPPSLHKAAPGQTAVQSWPGAIDGPLVVDSLSGLPQLVSQRILFGDSFEETVAVPEDRLSSHYYWTWYDNVSDGYKNWLMLANPDPDSAIYYEVAIPGVDLSQAAGATGTIPAGGYATARFPGVIGGPVEVRAWRDDTRSSPAKLVASQRVNIGGLTINEVYGTPAGELTDKYLWTWYDMSEKDVRNWVLVANPNPHPVYYRILVNGVSRDSGMIAPGERVTPMFSGLKGGPVEVQAWSDGIDGDVGGNVIASQRITWGKSFEEVKGYPVAMLSSEYHWTWYDQQSPQSRNWIVLVNPGAGWTRADVLVGGQVVKTVRLAPYLYQSGGYSSYVTLPGVIGGPVEVRAYADGGSYQVESDRRGILASQRVLWNGYLNETPGYVIP